MAPSSPHRPEKSIAVLPAACDRLVSLEGDASVTRVDGLEDALLKELGDLVCGSELKLRLKEIEQAFVADGFPSAKFSVELRPTVPGEASAIVHVELGPLLRVTSIRFKGTHRVPAAELRETTHVRVGEVWSKDRIEYDRNVLLSHCFDVGLIDAAVSVEASGGDITFVIEEGEVFRVGHLKLSGISLGPDADVLPLLGTTTSDVYSRATFTRGFQRLEERANERGEDVDVTWTAQVNREARTVDLVFQVATKGGR